MGQAEKHSDQRRLASAIGAEVAEGATAGHHELDVIHRDVVVELLGEAVRLNGPLVARFV